MTPRSDAKLVRWTSSAGPGDARLGLALGLATVGIALGLRLYRIADYTVFQGDQGVDALAARRVLVEHVFLLEGPATSVGGVHLGPAYYYLLALPMLVDWLNPLADAVFMAVLGAAAVGMVFVLARRWFGLWPAIAAAGLFAISPAAIVASRSAWNPAPAPFFVCLALLALDTAWRNGRAGADRTEPGSTRRLAPQGAPSLGHSSTRRPEPGGWFRGARAGGWLHRMRPRWLRHLPPGELTQSRSGRLTQSRSGPVTQWPCDWRADFPPGLWLLVAGLVLGVTVQLHYFALAIVVVCLAFAAVLVYREPSLAVWAGGGVLIFTLVLSPLVIHEFVSGFPNARAVAALASGELSAGTGGITAPPPQISAPRRAYEVFALGLVGIFLGGNIEVVAAVASVVLVGALSFGLMRKPELRWQLTLIAGLLGATVAEAVVYRGPIFEHYFLPISPVLYLAVAAALALAPINAPTQIGVGAGVAALAGLNLVNSQLREPPLYQLAQTQTVAGLIAETAQAGQSGSEKTFELWLLAGGEADGAYRFWLERMGHAPLPPDTPAPAKQLFIVCRRPLCDPASAQAQAGRDWSAARLAWQATVGDDDVMQLVR